MLKSKSFSDHEDLTSFVNNNNVEVISIVGDSSSWGTHFILFYRYS